MSDYTAQEAPDITTPFNPEELVNQAAEIGKVMMEFYTNVVRFINKWFDSLPNEVKAEIRRLAAEAEKGDPPA